MKKLVCLIGLLALYSGIALAQSNLQLRIEGMNNKVYADRIIKTLSAIESVENIAVDMEKRTVGMDYNAATTSPEQIKASVANVDSKFVPKDYDPKEVIERTVSFSVAQMNCGNCFAKIKKKLDDTPGVTEVTGNIEGKIVTVSYDANQIPADQLKNSFKEIDFTVSRYWANDAIRYIFYQADAFPAANAAAIEKKLTETPGVMDATVNPANHTISVSYNSKVVSEAELEEELRTKS